jgi:peptide/nickel transport system substrate-binding protein
MRHEWEDVMNSLKKLALGATALAFGAALAALPAQAQMQDKTLRIGAWDLAPSEGNPYFGIGTPSVFSWTPMFDMLTFVETDGNPTPALAESWQNVDATTWRFKLRPNVRFHNGEAFTAEAVINSWKWLQTEEGKTKGSSASSRTKFIADIVAVDDLTIEIKTAKPNPITPADMSVMMVVAPKAWADLGVDGFAKNPSGTGSYKYVSWQDDSKAVFEAVTDTWRPARIKHLEVYDLRERQPRMQALLSDQLDVALGATPDDMATLEAGGMKIDITAGSQVLTWGITQANAAEGVNIEPFKDKRVRQALNYAVNKQAMADGLLAGVGGEATGSGVPPTAFGHNPNVRPYPYDPDKARALLKEANFPMGMEIAINVVPGAFPADSEIFQQTAADLANVGLNVKVEVIPFGDWIKKFFPVGWPSAMWHNLWNAAPVMDATTSILNQSCGKGGKPYLCDDKQQAMLDAASNEFDPEKRKKILQDLIALQTEEAVNLFLIAYNNLHAYTPNLEGFRNVNQTIMYHEMSFK